MSRFGTAPKVFFDEKGEPKDVLISYAQYRRLLEMIEDSEDARALDKAIKNAKKFIPANEVWAKLEAAGKL